MSTRYYTIYDCSIPTLNPVTWGKLDELAKRYHEKFPDDALFVTSMSRDPSKFKNKESAHNFGYAFDLYSEGLKNPENRAWTAQEAAKLGLFAPDEYATRKKDWSDLHMHFQEADWRGNPEGYTPTPYSGQWVPSSVPQKPDAILEQEEREMVKRYPPPQEQQEIWGAEGSEKFSETPIIPEALRRSFAWRGLSSVHHHWLRQLPGDLRILGSGVREWPNWLNSCWRLLNAGTGNGRYFSC